MPLLTICVPAYNVEAYIGIALRSIVGQTFADSTIVVSDNSSTDRTPEVVGRFPQVRYARTERNIGGPANFNRCIELCTTEYVAVYHADDVYDPTIVEREIDIVRRHPEIDLVMALDRWINEDGRVWGRTHLPPELHGGSVIPPDVLIRSLARRTNTFLRAPTAIMRTSAVREVGGWALSRYRNAGDLDLWLKLARRGGVSLIDDVLMSYRVSSGQWSTSSDRDRIDRAEFFDVMDDHLAETRLSPRDLAVYSAHRSSDSVVRAINLSRRARTREALEILRSDADLSLVWHPAVPLRVRLHLLGGSILRASVSHGFGRGTARALHIIRRAGLRSALRRHAPWLAAPRLMLERSSEKRR